MFLIFGSAEEQPWNYPNKELREEEEKILNAAKGRKEVFATPSKENQFTSSIRSDSSAVI